MAGNHIATSEIGEIANQICGIEVFRDPDLTPQQVRGFELVLSEWREISLNSWLFLWWPLRRITESGARALCEP